MSQDSFEEEVRRMLEDVPLRSRLDASAVLDRAKRARRRRRTSITVLVVVLVAALALVIGVFGSGWWHRVAPAPVPTGTPNPLGTPTVTPSLKPTATPGVTPTASAPALVQLPRITVNRTGVADPPPGVTPDFLSVAQAAGVQQFADAIADGTIDRIVTSCWMYAGADLVDRWSDQANREQVLAALSQPITLGQDDVSYWGGPSASDSPSFLLPNTDDAFYCPAPNDTFTAGQAQLNITRLVDRHSGKPLVAEDVEAAHPLTCEGDWDGCSETWTATAGSLGDDQTTRNGISAKQWTILAGLVGVALRAVDPFAVGLPYDGSYDVFTTNGPASDTVVVFAPARPTAQGMAWGWKALVAVWTSGGSGSPGAADSSDWRISSAGIGPYKLNQPYLNSPSGTGDQPRCSMALMADDGTHGAIALADSAHFEWSPSAGDTQPALRSSVVMTWPGYARSASLTVPKPPRTAEGIGPGSTRAAVMAAYPDATPDAAASYDGDAVAITRDSVPIVFQFGNGLSAPQAPTDTVIAVVVGSPDGGWLNGCGG